MNAVRPVAFGRSLIAGGVGFALAAAALFATGAVPQAHAQSLPNHNSNAPIDVAADAFDVASRDGRATYSGNVVVRQDRLTMRAARVSVAFTTGSGVDINRVEATGGVTVVADTLNARGNVALYDLDRRLITMIGNVELTQDGNRMAGNRLVINVGSGTASLSGGGAATGENAGRVTGRFTVPQRNDPR
jgi:lipopolysaccharide export system protein LptA